jgi:hypothetical protein
VALVPGVHKCNIHQRLPHAVIVVQALPSLELVELTRTVRAADLEITDFENEASPAIYADSSHVSLVDSRIDGNTGSNVTASSQPHVLVGLYSSLLLENTTVEGSCAQDIAIAGDGQVYPDVSQTYLGCDLTMKRSLPLARAPRALFLTANDTRVLQIKQVLLPICFDSRALTVTLKGHAGIMDGDVHLPRT